MSSEQLQLVLVTLFALILTVRYLYSLAGGIRPVRIFNRKKSSFLRALEIFPVAGVGTNIFLVLRKSITPELYSILASGFELPLLLRQAGHLVAFFSLFILAAAYHALGDNWRVGLGDDKGELVTGGIFSRTRNPVYLFFNLFTFGLFLANGDYLMLICFLIVAVSLHLLITYEERELLQRFGFEYQSYTSRVPRYLCSFKTVVPGRLSSRPGEAYTGKERSR